MSLGWSSLYCSFFPYMSLSLIPASSQLWPICCRMEGEKCDGVSNSSLMVLSPPRCTVNPSMKGIGARCLNAAHIGCFNTPTGLSCSNWVRHPSACLPGLHAGISHSCHGWRGDRAPEVPGRNPQAPHHPSTPPQHCSHTNIGHPHLQGIKIIQSQTNCCG